jgi:DNA-binding NtrC family response regulator
MTGQAGVDTIDIDSIDVAQAHEIRLAGLVGRPLAEIEMAFIVETLRFCGGNKTHAANLLGISVRTVRNKLRHRALDPDGVARANGDGAQPSQSVSGEARR